MRIFHGTGYVSAAEPPPPPPVIPPPPPPPPPPQVAQTGDTAKSVIRRNERERPKRDRRRIFIVVTFGKAKQLGPDSGKRGELDNNIFARVQERRNPPFWRGVLQ